MTRVGSGRVRRCSKCHGSGLVNEFSNLAGRVGSSQEVFKSHGSGRVGSGRVGSGQEVFKYLGSGRVGS